MEKIQSVGPNRVLPSEVYTIVNCEEAVKLRLSVDDYAKSDLISIPGLLNSSAKKYGDKVALVPSGNLPVITYKEYHEKVHHVAKAFIKLGLESRHSVGILAFNCPEWFYSELAAIYADGVCAGIYTTNSPEAVLHILQNSRANIVVVDDAKQMYKIRQIRGKLPALKAVIQINGPFEDDLTKEDGYYKWSDIESMNVNDVEEEFECRLKNIAVNQCCVLVYTSGTVGMPKGVMLTHDNLIFSVRTFKNYYPQLEWGSERIVSYLPLSHIAAAFVDIVLAIYMGATVFFADRNALKGTLIKTMLTAKPTVFFGVPRVLEKIEEKFNTSQAQVGFLQKTLISWGRNIILQHNLSANKGLESETLIYKLAKGFIGNKIKSAIGLDKCKMFCVGGAPVLMEIKMFYLSIDLRICEVYGMSESGGVQCMHAIDDFNFASVGKPLVDHEVKVINMDSEGHGEICMKGRNICAGYLGEETKTKEAIDDEGWLHSGDLGYIDENGYVFITGRLKELIITSGGENIPPVPIEEIVKKELPVLSNAFLVGDKRKYLTMLVTLKTKVNPISGEPIDNLHEDTLELIKSLSLNYTTLSEILNAGPCPKMLEHIQNGINRANEKAISNAQKIQKFAILPRDFSIPTGELGPTFKVKRNVVSKMYEDIINKLYE